MAEYASIPAKIDQWLLMETEYNARWSQLAYLDGPGYTICDRMEAKLDLQRHFLSRSSFHGVENSIQTTQTESCSSHITSSMADLNQKHNLKMAEYVQEIRKSCARILELLQEEIDATTSTNDWPLTADETLLSMEPVQKYSVNEKSGYVEVTTKTTVSPYRTIAQSLNESNSKTLNPCFWGTKISLPVRSNATLFWRNEPYDPGPLGPTFTTIAKIAPHDGKVVTSDALSSIAGMIMIIILGASQTCVHRIRKTTESTTSIRTLFDAHHVLDEMDLIRNLNLSLVSIDNYIESILLRTETTSHVLRRTMSPGFTTKPSSLIVVFLWYNVTLEYQVIGVLIIHNGVHSFVEFKLSSLSQLMTIYALKGLTKGVLDLSFGIFKYEDHLDKTQAVYISAGTFNSHAPWYVAIDMYATLNLLGLVSTCSYEFHCVFITPSRLPALDPTELIYCVLAIPLPPPKPPDRRGCTVVATVVLKLPIEFSFVSCIWVIEEYCIKKGSDKVLMHEYNYIEAFLHGLYLLNGYACSMEIIIHSLNSVLISITKALILCGRLSCKDVVAWSSLIDEWSNYDHGWMAHVDTFLSMFRSALLSQLIFYMKKLIFESIAVDKHQVPKLENALQLKVSLWPFDTNETPPISQANLHVLTKMYLLKEFMEVKSLVNLDWEQMMVEMLDKLETNLILLINTTFENKLQNRVSSCIGRLSHMGIQQWILNGDTMERVLNIDFVCSFLFQHRQLIINCFNTLETKSFEGIDVKSAIGIVHHVQTRFLVLGIFKSFTSIGTKYIAMGFGSADCANFSLRAHFSLSFGSAQQWDFGGQFDISTTTRTYRFKQWDPGKLSNNI